MNIQKLAAQYAGMFETIKKSDDKVIYTVKDDKEIEAILKAHKGNLPNDHIYKWFYNSLLNISDCEIKTFDDLQEIKGEIIDGLVSVYTCDLTSWLNDDAKNVFYIDEALKRYGMPNNGSQLLSQAQGIAIEEVFDQVVELLKNSKHSI